MQHNIKCMSWAEEDLPEWPAERSWEINIDGKVWPCCIFVVDAYPVMSKELLNTKEFMELYEKDPNWNSLHHHTLEEIQSHPFYTEIVHPTGWESDNPPNICAKYCGKCRTTDSERASAGLARNSDNINK